MFQSEGLLYTPYGIMCMPGPSYIGQGSVCQPGRGPLMSARGSPRDVGQGASYVGREAPILVGGLPCRLDGLISIGGLLCRGDGLLFLLYRSWSLLCRREVLLCRS